MSTKLEMGHELSDLLSHFSIAAADYAEQVYISKRRRARGEEITAAELAGRDYLWEKMMQAFIEYDTARTDPNWHPPLRDFLAPGAPLFPANSRPAEDTPPPMEG